MGLLKRGSGTLSLDASNTFTGATIVSAGALLVNGALGNSPVTVLNGATLGGNGTLGASATVNSGATLSPGANGLGILAVNGTVTLRGTTFMELNRALGTNDLLLVGSTLSYGGTLVLTNLSGVLAPDDTLKLFSAQSYTGAFTNFVPATPGPGLTWDASLLATNGTLKVAVAPRPVLSGIALIGTNLVLTAANGVPGEKFYLLQSTNLSLPATNWTPVLTNTFGLDGQVAVTNPVNASATGVFYLLELH
jgi:fibronectin-binding autotransporter adhesin